MKPACFVPLVALLFPALASAEPAADARPAARLHVELAADGDRKAAITTLEGRLHALDQSALVPILRSSVVESGAHGIAVEVEVAWRPCAGRAMGCIVQGLAGAFLHPADPPPIAQRCSERRLAGWTEILGRVLTRPGEIAFYRAVEEPAGSLAAALRAAPDLADARVRTEYMGLVVVEGATLPAIRAAASDWEAQGPLRVLTTVLGARATNGVGDERESVGLRVVERDPAMTIRSVDGADLSEREGDYSHPALRIRFTQADGRRFGELTASMVERILGIVMDGQLQSAPVVKERIDGGSASLVPCGGETTYADCTREIRELAAVLRGGALPVHVRHVATDGSCAE